MGRSASSRSHTMKASRSASSPARVASAISVSPRWIERQPGMPGGTASQIHRITLFSSSVSTSFVRRRDRVRTAASATRTWATNRSTSPRRRGRCRLIDAECHSWLGRGRGVVAQYEDRSGSGLGSNQPAKVAVSLALVDVARGTSRVRTHMRRQKPGRLRGDTIFDDDTTRVKIN